MDAVKFLRENKRMCTAQPCVACPVYATGQGCTEDDNPELVVATVEEWAAAHPRKTRQSVFLEQWLNAARDMVGVVNVCPKLLDVDISCTDDETERTGLCKACDDCRREFWMQEVE